MKHCLGKPTKNQLVAFWILLMFVAFSIVGCSNKEVIDTYLVANADGSVDKSSLHARASSRLDFEAYKLITSFRRKTKNGEVFDAHFSVHEKSHKLTNVSVDKVLLLGVKGRDFENPIELQSTRTKTFGDQQNSVIEEVDIDLRRFSEPASLKIRVCISGEIDGDPFSHDHVIDFVRTTAEMPFNIV